MSVTATGKADKNMTGEVCSKLTGAQLDLLKELFTHIPKLVPNLTKASILQQLAQQMAFIDKKLNKQLKVILLHTKLQHLEASWRGLQYLVKQAIRISHVKIRVLNVTWQEIVHDIEKAIEFDQSALFNKIYSEQFGMSGGEPFNVLLGDYYIQHKRSMTSATDDISTLAGLAQIAEAAFAPFICSVSPTLFGLEHFKDMQQFLNFSELLLEQEYLRWKMLQQLPACRFVGIVIPRVAYRAPYQADTIQNPGFSMNLPQTTLWGNACYCVGAVMLRSYDLTGWFSDIMGDLPVIKGGLVTGLPTINYATDNNFMSIKSPCDMTLLEGHAKDLSQLGFIVLSSYRYTNELMFYAMRSFHQDRVYQSLTMTEDHILARLLPYLFCVCRIAHYIKVIFRDKIGLFTTAASLENFLKKWIAKYINGNEDISPELKAKYPLQQADIIIRTLVGKPNSYTCTLRIKPHVKAAYLAPLLEFSTELMI